MSRRAGKEPMVDQSGGKKRRQEEQPRRSTGGIRIGSPDRNQTPTPLPPVQRFINPRAMSLYNTEYVSRRLIIEKEVIVGKVDATFIELLRDKDWGQLMVIPPRLVNETMVREFFANLDETQMERGFVMVRRVKVPFSPEIINEKYNLDPEVSLVDHRFELTLITRAGRDPLEELRMKIDPTTPWTFKLGKPSERKDLTTTRWSEDWRVKCKFIQNRLRPTDNITHFGIEDLGLLYALEFGLDVNVGGIIYNEVYNHVSNPKRCIICPHLIYSLCLDAKVPEYKSDHKAKNLPGIQKDSLRRAPQVTRPTPRTQSSDIPSPSLDRLERRVLSISHTVRNWFRMSNRNQADILANQRDLNSGTRISEDSRFDARTSDFLFEEDIEEALDRMHLGASGQQAATSGQGAAGDQALMDEDVVGEANNEVE